MQLEWMTLAQRKQHDSSGKFNCDRCQCDIKDEDIILDISEAYIDLLCENCGARCMLAEISAMTKSYERVKRKQEEDINAKQ